MSDKIVKKIDKYINDFQETQKPAIPPPRKARIIMERDMKGRIRTSSVPITSSQDTV